MSTEPDRQSAPQPEREPGIVVGVTGASGVVYAQRLVRYLLTRRRRVLLVVSAAGRAVMSHELGRQADGDPWGETNRELLEMYSERDWFAPFCSGTHELGGMVIVPASMGTVGAVASGVSIHGIHRAADVCLKERRPLVVVPRETPFSTIHLENLLTLARAGAIVLPPSPAFYQEPRSVDDLVDFVVSRILDALGIENTLIPRWKTPSGEDSREVR